MKLLQLMLIAMSLTLVGCAEFGPGRSDCHHTKHCERGTCKKDKSCCKDKCGKCKGKKSCKKAKCQKSKKHCDRKKSCDRKKKDCAKKKDCDRKNKDCKDKKSCH